MSVLYTLLCMGVKWREQYIVYIEYCFERWVSGVAVGVEMSNVGCKRKKTLQHFL
jgi:hypothetical protein